MKFTWKIENFGCFKGGFLQSPSFPSHSTTWDVMVYLTDSLSIELHQLKRTCFTLNCSFAFLDSQGYPLVWKEKSKRFPGRPNEGQSILSIIFQDFIRRDDIFGSRRNAFLPNDILTIQCRMWVNSDDLIIEPLSLFARTRIEPRIKVSKKSFTWDVPNALKFCTELERVETMTIKDESLTMKLLLSIYYDFKVKITVSLFRIHLKLTISVMDISGRKVQFANDEFQVEKSGQEWNLGTNITKNLLKCYSNSLLHGDTLSLHFSCILSGIVTFNGLVDENEIVNIQQPIVDVGHFSEPSKGADEPEIETPKRSDHSDTISQAIHDMYEEGLLSDFDLKVGDRVFPVHKAVLGVRSRVFRVMFTADMKEKEDNCVVIEDVDENTLKRMLQFVYSDRVDEEMELDSVCSLYDAADKYALESLKQKCSSILKSGLCALSVLDVLTLADMHQDQELKSAALDFILWNDKDIVGSERWNRFEEENKPLAFDTFRNLYVKKMNG